MSVPDDRPTDATTVGPSDDTVGPDADPAANPPAGPPERIGRYRILGLIGGGGMGEVYRAEQRTPVRREVALKLIKQGMDTKAVIARFDAERQALAMMDHPNIAKIYDADADAAGRPYFVMEYVAGRPITAYADANHLSIRERVALFQQVCAAVQHAHQKGIIHRDLKPGNVLVATADGRPQVKVIDFGIAKATNQRLTDLTLFTAHEQAIGTPLNMSPEQADASPDIDTRTDVFSLGVMLYELLAGSTPFTAADVRAGAVDAMRRLIRDVDPPKPSTRLSGSGDRWRPWPRPAGRTSAGSRAWSAGTWTGSPCGRWRRTGPAGTTRPAPWPTIWAGTWPGPPCGRPRPARRTGPGSSPAGTGWPSRPPPPSPPSSWPA